MQKNRWIGRVCIVGSTLLCWCAFIACQDIAEPEGVNMPLSPQDTCFGGWLWEDPETADWQQALDISNETIIHFRYKGGGSDSNTKHEVTRWLDETNPDLKAENPHAISSSYPAGFAILGMMPISSSAGSIDIEAIKLRFYLHPGRQSLIVYNDGRSSGYTIAEFPYFIYKRADIALKDDGVPKRITITGIPASKFIGGARAARVELVHPFYGAAARNSTTGLAETVVFYLKKPGPSNQDSNEEWTGLGTFRLEFQIFADSYADEGYEIVPGWVMGAWFRLNRLEIKGENTIIPYSTEWDIHGVQQR